MGVPHLWLALQSCRQQESLAELLISEALTREGTGKWPINVAVDANPWMYAAQASVSHTQSSGASLALTGGSAERNVLLRRLSQLLVLPANFGFFFDGPKVPDEKRNIHVGSRAHNLARDFKELINAFGFQAFNAPGESDAEMAYLNQIGIVDFVLTPDSDIFLFGATSVIQSPQDPNNQDRVVLYKKENLMKKDPNRHLQAGILFIAVLAGGDYNPCGLRGCGFETAYALSKSDLAKSLWNAFNSDKSEAELLAFLFKWHKDLHDELAFNSLGLLQCCCLSLAQSIPADFPNVEVVLQYVHPATSRSTSLIGLPDNLAMLFWTRPKLLLPNTGQLTCLLSKIFDWDWGEMFGWLVSHAWTGHLARQLIHLEEAQALRQTAGLGFQSISNVSRIDKSTKHRPSAFLYYHVQIWPLAVSAEALKVFEEETGQDLTPGDIVLSESATVTVPAPILHRAVPGLVDEYHRHWPSKARPTYWSDLSKKIEHQNLTAAGARDEEETKSPTALYKIVMEEGKEVYEIL